MKQDDMRKLERRIKLWKEHQQGTRGHYCPKCDEALQEALAQAERKAE